MFYKNISHSVKVIHNVEFKPGEIKEVSSYINSRDFIAVSKPDELAKPQPVKSEPVQPKSAKKVRDVDEAIPAEPIEKPIKEENLDGTDSN